MVGSDEIPFGILPIFRGELAVSFRECKVTHLVVTPIFLGEFGKMKVEIFDFRNWFSLVYLDVCWLMLQQLDMRDAMKT